MARDVNPSESPTVKAMDRAIDQAIEGDSRYPERAAFVDADSPQAGRESQTHSTTATRSRSSHQTGASD
jgi:hypothetical protein